jgi:hypothetical protein
MKSGDSPDHLLEETYADAAYQAAGMDVPAFQVYRDKSGKPVKLSEFLPGAKSLGSVNGGADITRAQRVRAEIRKGFVADALFGNWDVVGMGMDNILVEDSGKVWRIDNGGSFRFRAQGTPKTPAQWNEEVTELKTLLDASKNPTTAKIFKGITDAEIAEQIRHLLTKKDAILATVPEEVRAVLAKRFDYLEKIAGPVPGKLSGKFPANFATRASLAGSAGLALPWDEDQFEDAQILAWEELDQHGNPLTRIQCKLRPKASEKVVETMSKVMEKAPDYVTPTAYDNDYSVLLVASGNVAYHTGDKKYNIGKLNQVLVLKTKLENEPQTPKTKAYIKIAEEIIDAWKNEKPHTKIGAIPPKFEEEKPAETETPKGPTIPGVKVAKWGTFEYVKKTISPTGILQQSPGNVGSRYDGNVVADFENGATAVHVPFSNQIIGYSHRGIVSITVPGSMTTATLEKASEAMDAMGLKTGQATMGTQRVLAISKTLSLRKWHDDVTAGILANTTTTPDEKAEKLLEYLEKKQGLRVPKDTDMSLKQTKSLGVGYAYQDRIDMTEAEIVKGLPNTHLTHSSSDVAGFVESVVSAGGDITSTMERLRKGISISAGMSPGADQGTGGASYFFMRIKRTTTPATLEFPIRLLARSDAISATSDRFGEVKPGYESIRQGTIDEYAACRSYGSNETIFKNGLSIWDATHIRAGGERARLLAFFRGRGIYKWPDGRKLEDVIL